MSALKHNPLLVCLALVGAAACSSDDDKKTNTVDSGVTADEDGGTSHEEDSGSGGGDEGTANLPDLPEEMTLPIVFVHGFAGSAAQFESQAIRFAMNGYPADRIRAFEHDGAGLNVDAFVTGLEGFVDDVLKEFKTDKVFLAGHSRGTFVSSTFLSDPARAAKVAKYVSLDGSGCMAADTAGVPCIAPSQQNQPGQKHVEVATSKETFSKMFEFYVGRPADVIDIVKQPGPVSVSGRAVIFPDNVGRAGTTLEIWEIDQATGHRKGSSPLKSFSIDEQGFWGPFEASSSKYYELSLNAKDSGSQHFYSQPFLRDTKFVRLLSGNPDSESRMHINTGDGHASLTALRMREWTVDDVLQIKTHSPAGGDQDTVNGITGEAGAPREGSMGGGLSFAPIAIYFFDDTTTPGESSLSLLDWFPTQPFQTGVDVFMPATDPPDGTITLTSLPRGDASMPQVLNVANWASSDHLIMAMFSDFPQP